MKISVIIPVYNVEKYIVQCISSVLCQTYTDFEIILVDDGSPDRCPEICDEYAKKDKRITALHKKNGGLSDARNAGIRKATGDYIIFLDSDDFWDDKKALEKLATRVKKTKAQVLNYTYKKFFESTGKYIPYFKIKKSMPLELTTKDNQMQYLKKHNLYIASACNKMVQRDLFKENNLYFKKGVFSEDIEWAAELLLYAQTLDFIDLDFYCYRQRENSIRYTISDKTCTDLKNNIIACVKIAAKVKEEWKGMFYQYAAFQYATFFIVQAQAEKEQKQNIKELKKYKWLLSYHGAHRKLQLLYYMCKILGYKNLCSLIRKVFQLRNKLR